MGKISIDPREQPDIDPQTKCCGADPVSMEHKKEEYQICSLCEKALDDSDLEYPDPQDEHYNYLEDRADARRKEL